MKFYLSILTFFISIYSVGQKEYCYASVDKNSVGQNEIFIYEIITNQDCEIIAPDFKSLGLEIVAGPKRGNVFYQNYSSGNASQGNEYSLTYSLVASKKGNFVIPAAEVKCKTKSFFSSLVKISVGENSAVLTPDNEVRTHFLKATSNKESVYVGEAFVISLKFYSKKPPSTVGQVDLGTVTLMFRENLYREKQNYTIEEELVDNEHYFVVELYRDVCIPVQSGKAEINPYYASIELKGGLFGEWVEAYSNKVIVDVKELPTPKPENFNGLVGSFDLIHSINKTTLNVGQLIDLKIKIQGTGNLNAFDKPQLNFPDQFHVFDPESMSNISLTEGGLSGSIDYEFVISPDEKGLYTLSPFSFSYFDLEENKYRSLTTQEFSIQVNKGDRIYTDNSGSRKDPTIEDINYIHSDDSSFFGAGDFLFGTFFYMMGIFFPFGLCSIFILFKHKRDSRSEKEIVEIHQKEVKKTVFKDFKTTKNLINSGQEKEGLRLFQQTLINYFMVKLDLSLSSLSKQVISASLIKKNIDAELVREFGVLWNKIEMAQYSPSGTENLYQTVEEAEKLINKMNKKL